MSKSNSILYMSFITAYFLVTDIAYICKGRGAFFPPITFVLVLSIILIANIRLYYLSERNKDNIYNSIVQIKFNNSSHDTEKLVKNIHKEINTIWSSIKLFLLFSIFLGFAIFITIGATVT